MARGPSRLSEELPANASRCGRAQSPAAASAGSEAPRAVLVKNNLALDLKRSAAEVWLVGPVARDLVKNNLASSQIFILQPLAPATGRDSGILKRTTSLVWRCQRPYNEDLPMLTTEQINEIHRLHLVEKWSLRKIARHLHIGRRTIAKYLDTPAPTPAHRDRASKLDPFKPAIAELLRQDPDATRR